MYLNEPMYLRGSSVTVTQNLRGLDGQGSKCLTSQVRNLVIYLVSDTLLVYFTRCELQLEAVDNLPLIPAPIIIVS